MRPNPSPYTYPAQVVRVVDGDTAICRIDLGFHISAEHSIRLADINAPELFSGTSFERGQGLASKVALTNLVDFAVARIRREWPFILVTDKNKQTFGRYIGTLWEVDKLEVIETPASINDQMVTGGHAAYQSY